MSMAAALSAGNDPGSAKAPAGNERADDCQRPSFLAILRLLRCPVDNGTLSWDSSAQRLACAGGAHVYLVEAGVPCLFAPNEWPDGQTDVTDIVKAFYEETPFPNYDGLDTRDSLRRKTTERVFGRLLDEQLPPEASILEVGCGTGQMTNFLGMGRGRTVLGGDICLNSLRLAGGFRDRFSIHNAHFVQLNLFRPPFEENSFDVVISNGVLHHTSDSAGAFRSIARLVKPGGVIVIGLNNWLGRLPALWRRWLIDRLGPSAGPLGSRARDKGEEARGRAWFMDHYKHPHETRHSMTELLGWFDAAGFDFTASIPTIGDREFDPDMRLFSPQPAGSHMERLSSEIEMLLSGGADGGLYIMMGRKRR